MTWLKKLFGAKESACVICGGTMGEGEQIGQFRCFDCGFCGRVHLSCVRPKMDAAMYVGDQFHGGSATGVCPRCKK